MTAKDMAEIELVIKISEKTYKYIQSLDWKNEGRWFSEEWRAIHNGTPLPKGHGRLIDADERRKEIDEEDRWVVDLAETIIQADTESEDKE